MSVRLYLSLPKHEKMLKAVSIHSNDKNNCVSFLQKLLMFYQYDRCLRRNTYITVNALLQKISMMKHTVCWLVTTAMTRLIEAGALCGSFLKHNIYLNLGSLSKEYSKLRQINNNNNNKRLFGWFVWPFVNNLLLN